MERVLIWLACARMGWLSDYADLYLFARRFNLVQEVLHGGTVRELERLESCYRTAGLPQWADYLKRHAGGDYARFVIERTWQRDHI